MTLERWNPQTALRRAVPFFQDLPHIGKIRITTCGGIVLHIEFDESTSELVAYDDADNELGRVYIELEP